MSESDYDEWIEDNPYDVTAAAKHFQSEKDFVDALDKYRESRERKIWNLFLIQLAEKDKTIEKLSNKLREFKVFGTDECPMCETAPWGLDYNRVTLFYKPTEHELHDLETKGGRVSDWDVSNEERGVLSVFYGNEFIGAIESTSASHEILTKLIDQLAEKDKTIEKLREELKLSNALMLELWGKVNPLSSHENEYLQNKVFYRDEAVENLLKELETKGDKGEKTFC